MLDGRQFHYGLWMAESEERLGADWTHCTECDDLPRLSKRVLGDSAIRMEAKKRGYRSMQTRVGAVAQGQKKYV